MSTELTTTGSGSLGDLQPNWSVESQATPVTIGDESGSTGQVKFDAEYNELSEFVLGNDSTFTDTDLGSITGRVDSLNVDGDGYDDDTSTVVSGTTSTPLTILNAEQTIPPVPYGVPGAAIFNVLYENGQTSFSGFDTPTYNNDPVNIIQYPLLFGVDGFENESPHEKSGTYFSSFFPTGTENSVQVNEPTTSALPGGGLSFTGANWLDVTRYGFSTPLTRESIAPNLTFAIEYLIDYNVSTLMYQGFIDGNDDQSVDQDQLFIWGIDGSADEVYLIAPGTNATHTPQTIDISTLDTSEPILVTIQVRSTTHVVISITDHTDSTVWGYVTLLDPTTYPAPLWLVGWGGGNQTDDAGEINILAARTFFFEIDFGSTSIPPGLSVYVPSYFTQATGTGLTDNTTVATGAAVGYTGSVWNYIKQICAAYNVEFNMNFTLEDAGTTVLDLDQGDFVPGTARLDLDSTATGRSIDVINYNVQPENYGVLYNAFDTGRIFSVEPGEVLEETVQIEHYAQYLQPPTYTDALPVPDGSYYIIGADNLPIDEQEWIDYGGSVSVSISPDGSNLIDIRIIAPQAIPGVDSPYSFAVSDGETSYPAFSILGSGVFTDVETVNILAGTNPDATAVEVATTIDNVGMTSLERVYDRASWALLDASGPTMKLSGTIPTSLVPSFALTPGRLVTYKDSIYRIATADIGPATTSITATRHVTVGDIDALWSGMDVGDFDTFWDGYNCSDFKIRPLRS